MKKRNDSKNFMIFLELADPDVIEDIPHFRTAFDSREAVICFTSVIAECAVG